MSTCGVGAASVTVTVQVPKYLKKTSVMMVDGDDNRSVADGSTLQSVEGSVEPETAGPDAVVPSRPYHWTDLRIGMTIAVAALNITIVDADPFTRRFYDEKNMPLAGAIPVQVRRPSLRPSCRSIALPFILSLCPPLCGVCVGASALLLGGQHDGGAAHARPQRRPRQGPWMPSVLAPI